MRSVLRPCATFIAAAALLSCSEPSAPRRPAAISIISGSAQSAAVATVLPQPVVVEVRDANGRGLGGVSVAWSVSEGGGTVGSATSSTDSDGRAQVTWTLGTAVGANRLQGTVSGVAPVFATATAQPGAPAEVVVQSGSAQSAMVGSVLALPLIARARDAHGNPVPGAAVTFTPTSGSGSVSPTTANTNASGDAQTQWTLGPATGAHAVDAAVTGAAGAARFTATATAQPSATPLQNDVPVTGVASTQGANRYYRVSVPANATALTVTLSGGTGDVDLYVRRGSLPTIDTNDCSSTSPTANETCTIPMPAEAEWYVLLDAYTAYSNTTLRATYVIGGSLAITLTGLPQGANAGVTVTGPGGFSRTLATSLTLTSLMPGSYTINAPHVVNASTVYNASVTTQQVSVTSGASTSATVAYTQATGGLNLDITGTYITQSVQRPDGTVPLIAGRDGLVRVFARANALNSPAPVVRVRLYRNGSVVDTRMVAPSTVNSPVTNDDGVLTTTWNVLLPGSLIQPGTSMLVDVDPANAVSETNESDNMFPQSGTPMSLNVRTAPVMEARFVPVLQVPNGLQGDVTAENVDTYTTKANAIYPMPSLTADVRAPYSFSGVLASNYDAEWSRLLSEINAVRVADGSARYYYGVIKPSYTSGGTGLGYIGVRASIGVEWANWRAETVAHEWGHNFNRLHVACGNPANPDPNYPYTDRPGALGQHGYDLRNGILRLHYDHQDIMSYCQPTWASDYTYEAVMNFRGTATGQTASAAERSLLVWGRITPDGVVLEPAFEVVTRPSLPTRGGAHRIVAKDAQGGTVLDLSFDGIEIDHMPGERHFAYAIPLRSLRGAAPAELRVSGRDGREAVRRVETAAAAVTVTRAAAGRVRVRWDSARSPVVIVRDPRTGEVLSFARGGDISVATNAREVEVNVSNGPRSEARRYTVAQ
jgi:hypothetical protein